MNRLVINTANTQLDIVLEHDGAVKYKSISSVMHHNETMLPEIDNLLKENNLKIGDIAEFGVVVGPGSFTGIRVGIATIKAFRDSLGATAKGINNLHLLFKCAQKKMPDVETVAILGSKDSYFVAKLINGIVYTYERNLTLEELKGVAEGKPVGMYEVDP
ncbi:MAG: tRNA (adenosine(37)-N6)-threonylcarbamoyltransferase complex dimerization subunit type 1 TsaB, partial [Clostridia bacterium]|nr:tRNA (adenosine(37)-N6)-threonylcarbamoyltransferase complex dimerization subunit type 1 TsaB [Clostridia bacterium]